MEVLWSTPVLHMYKSDNKGAWLERTSSGWDVVDFRGSYISLQEGLNHMQADLAATSENHILLGEGEGKWTLCERF